MEGLLPGIGIEDEGRPAMVDADEIGADPGRVRPRIFLEPDHLLDDRQAAAAIFPRPVDSGPAGIEQTALPGAVEADRIGRVHRPPFGRDIGAEPVAAFGPEPLFSCGKPGLHQPFRATAPRRQGRRSSIGPPRPRALFPSGAQSLLDLYHLVI
jgi:hypothetical protein